MGEGLSARRAAGTSFSLSNAPKARFMKLIC